MWWLIAVTAGLAVTALLPMSFPGDGGPTGVDRAAADLVQRMLGAHPGVFEALVIPSNGYVVLPVLLLGAVWYARRRRWWVVGFLLVAPELVVAINAMLLKPLWHRQLHDYLAYPSGHTVQFVAIATAFVLAAERIRTRIVGIAVAVVVLAGVAIGMIGLGYHHATDVLGGAGAAVGFVTASYAALDSLRARRSAAPTARTTAATPPR
ncbi:phosphatase PAP2 family protein [Nocardia sp. CDC159]|uniref:Phosphatase PAP2 family protein n=1 Tax=Nocardia pulmonis TaxID=2951408 RepID=A0A9X2IVV9_9NOCA|nr:MULTISPECIES: phosphatase PAP2 family protein [Nocardia]MCM6772195.1 phosphatase PAP2 family protein [Nocardia pulmonis]MCM6785147.1 phosphatase PAP2 family protein [Nocardia sp. CDC159]